jgi:hypothetical protein
LKNALAYRQAGICGVFRPAHRLTGVPKVAPCSSQRQSQDCLPEREVKSSRAPCNILGTVLMFWFNNNWIQTILLISPFLSYFKGNPKSKLEKTKTARLLTSSSMIGLIGLFLPKTLDTPVSVLYHWR